jgi:hypothetical protein
MSQDEHKKKRRGNVFGNVVDWFNRPNSLTGAPNDTTPGTSPQTEESK